MKKEKSDTVKVSPQEYLQILKGLNLDHLSLEECTAKVRKEKWGTELPYSWKDQARYELVSPSIVNITHHYELIATASSKRDFALRILCVFSLSYSAKQALTEDFMDIFIKRNVPLNTWPYFRELVQNMTQRMNVPPLVLPLLI